LSAGLWWGPILYFKKITEYNVKKWLSCAEGYGEEQEIKTLR
jgi:hypothetical protein